jgi:hypothetical protein
LAGISRVLITVQLATLRFQAQHHSELLLHSLYSTAPRCDREIVALPEVRAMFSRTFPTASAPGVAGLIEELMLLVRPWTVDLKHIQGPSGMSMKTAPAVFAARCRADGLVESANAEVRRSG